MLDSIYFVLVELYSCLVIVVWMIVRIIEFFLIMLNYNLEILKIMLLISLKLRFYLKLLNIVIKLINYELVV